MYDGRVELFMIYGVGVVSNAYDDFVGEGAGYKS